MSGGTKPSDPLLRVEEHLQEGLMKTTFGASAALLLAGTIYVQPAHAQPAPQGSYLNSCTHVGMDRDKLIADCRRPDGGWQRTVLDVDRCVGDIANINGRLNCDRGPREGYGSSRGPDWGAGYGSSRAEDWRDAQRARCWHILDPVERERCWWGR
jgi:CVNH domain